MYLLIAQLIMSFTAFFLLGAWIQVFLEIYKFPIYFALPCAIITWYFTSILILITINRIARWPIRNTTGELTSWQVAAWGIANTTFDIAKKLTHLVFVHTPIPPIIYRLFGMKIGKNVNLFGYIYDPDMIEIGDNVLLGTYAVISGHYIHKGKVYRYPVKIGSNVVIGAYSIIAPGTIIEDNTTLQIMSAVRPNRKITSGTWGSVPSPTKIDDKHR